MTTKSLLYSLSPPVLRSAYQRVEASPLGYRLAKGSFWSLAGSFISRGLAFLSAILVGRILGKEGFGELGIIQSTVGMFGTLASFGMALTANKHVAEFKRADPERAGRILGMASAVAWVTSTVIAIGLILSGPWLAARTLNAPHLGGLVQLGALLLFLGAINGSQAGALAGFEAFKTIARNNLVSGLLTFPMMVIGAWQWGVAGAVWSLIGSQVVNCLLCHAAVRVEAARFNIRVRFSGAWSELGLFWAFSLPTVLSGVLNSVVAWGAAALVVNQAAGYGDIGVYNAALRVKMLPEALAGMLISPMLPVLSEAFGKGDRRTFERTLLVSFLFATLLIVPVSLLQAAAPSLTLLPYGAEYAGSPGLVVWLMLHAVLYALMFPMGSILVSMGAMWFNWIVNLVFAGILAVLAWVLIPRYGAAGYAAALVIAFALANIPCVVFLYRRLPEVARVIRWALVAGTAVGLFAVSVVAYLTLNVGAAIAAGAAAACAFVGLKYWLHGAGLRVLTASAKPGPA